MLYHQEFMNLETGEILPDSQAIAQFYQTHTALESWLDVWQLVGDTDVPLDAPNFTNTIATLLTR